MKEYIINPSALSYLCEHCAYLEQNYGLRSYSISPGITQTLDSIEKQYFLGDCKKINPDFPDGETIDPYNQTFFSKTLKDNKGRSFRIKGKGDAIIKFNDGTSGIIDYKTSKFKKNKKSDSFKEQDLQKKIDEYNPQLHAYYLLYSNLETDENFLREKYIERWRSTKEETIIKGVKKTIDKINEIKINKAKLFGLVFIYPEDHNFTNNIQVNFSFQYCDVAINIENFMDNITKYLDILYSDNPPPPNEYCSNCKGMHEFFYDENKLKNY